MIIQHSDLVKSYQLLMDALSRSDIFHKEIRLSYDYYWDTSPRSKDDIYVDPKPTMGSIEHDIERVHQLISDKDISPAHFRWLGNVLIAISDTILYQVEQGESIGLFMETDNENEEV